MPLQGEKRIKNLTTLGFTSHMSIRLVITNGYKSENPIRMLQQKYVLVKSQREISITSLNELKLSTALLNELKLSYATSCTEHGTYFAFCNKFSVLDTI